MNGARALVASLLILSAVQVLGFSSTLPPRSTSAAPPAEPTAATTMPTSASPTAVRPISPFELVFGARGSCALQDAGGLVGACIAACSDSGGGDSNGGGGGRCVFSVSRPVQVVVVSFDAQGGHEHLVVNPGTNASIYNGSAAGVSSLNGARWAANTTLLWESGGVGHPNASLLLCANGSGFVMPPTAAPTTSVPTTSQAPTTPPAQTAAPVPPLPVRFRIPGCAASNQRYSTAHLGFLYECSSQGLSFQSVSNVSLDPQTVSVQLSGNTLSEVPHSTFVNLTALKYLALSSNELSALPRDAFSNLMRLEQLLLNGNRLTTLAPGTFGSMQSLQLLDLTSNMLTEVLAGVFAGLPSLQSLLLSHNSIGAISLQQCACTLVATLDLSHNRLTAFPSAADLFGDLAPASTSLSTLLLNSNQLVLTSSTLSGFTGLSMVAMQNNGIMSFPQDVIDRLSPVGQVYVSPNPIECSRAANETAITCDACSLGLTFDTVSNACVFPPFGPSSSNWSTTTDTSGNFGSVTSPKVLYVGLTYREPAPALTPKMSAFAGYHGSFSNIEFEATFEPQGFNISCTDAIVAGNTQNAPLSPHRVNNSAYILPGCAPTCGPEHLYNSPEVTYKFYVADGGGFFVFDSCLSSFTTSLAVYRLDETSRGSAPSLVFPNTERTIFPGSFPWLQNQSAAGVTGMFPFVGGCDDLSQAARTPPLHLGGPAQYLVALQAGQIWNRRSVAFGGSSSGDYVLRMICGADNQTVPDPARQLGLQVDKTTGAAIATPTTPGNFTFNLTAVDTGGTGALATIRQWSVAVRPLPMFQRTLAPFVYRPPIPDTVRLALNWTYVFVPPADSRSVATYFAGVTGDEHVTYFVTVGNSSLAAADDLLVNPLSGLIQLIPRRLGRFVLWVVASDGTRQVNVTGDSPWVFEVLSPEGAWNEADGPNGRGCGPGVESESLVFHNGSFTCDCTGTPMTGDNCDAVRHSTSSRAVHTKSMYSVVGGLLGAFLVVVLAGYVWHQVQMRRLQWVPVDFAVETGKLLAELGLAPQLDIAADQLGFALTVHGLPTDPDDEKAVLLTAEITKGLRSALSKLFQSARNRTIPSIAWGSATVRLAVSERAELAVVVQQPPVESKGESNIGDKILVRLQQAIQFNRLAFKAGGNELAVTSAALMVPKRIPREIDRKTVTRLGERLGEGVAAEVFKAVVTGRAGSGPPMLVASKEPHANGGMSREDVEREAAMMALLEHPNVLGLVGVVTVPTSMPALILLEFCEHGSLESYLHRHKGAEHQGVSAEENPLTMALRLSFCVDIASGMDYLSSRRVVHRDVAARNVLLDSMLSCKVSDFGLALLCPSNNSKTDDGTYKANYVRLRDGEQPIRWCSVEALQEARYSTASDVWAFGVTVWEIMSTGTLPYEDVCLRGGNLMLVAEHVMAGGTLQRPDGCPETVFAELMIPCWDPKPSGRPGFAELGEAARALGGVMGTGRADDAGGSADGAGLAEPRDNLDDPVAYDAEFWASREGLELRGVSMHHLETQLHPAVLEATREPFTVRGRPVAPPPIDDVTVDHMVETVIKPLCKEVTCPRDGGVGCAYVDSLLRHYDAGPATALLSYSWSNRLKDIVDALAIWTDSNKRDPMQTRFWVCSLCLNQHRMHATLTPEQLANEFGPRVTTIGRILPLLTPWNAPIYVQRAWCLFELFTAIRNTRSVAIDVILPKSDRKAFCKAMADGNYAALEAVLGAIRAEEATATEAADLEAIHTYVNSLPGGFPALNEEVRGHLRRWFEGQGAVLTSARVLALRASQYSKMVSGPDVQLKPERRSSTADLQAHASPVAGVARQASARTAPFGNAEFRPPPPPPLSYRGADRPVASTHSDAAASPDALFLRPIAESEGGGGFLGGARSSSIYEDEREDAALLTNESIL